MSDLMIENEYRPRTDARWIKVRCPKADCLLVEAYVEPASRAEALIAAVRDAHDRIHAADEIERREASDAE